MPHKHITELPIDLNLVLAGAHHAQAGAIVLFSGEARNHHDGQSVSLLEYEAQVEMAEASISSILAQASEKWGLHYAFAQHRIGKVGISESAVVVVTSAAHRHEAYEANRFIIDQIKAQAPIWKKEHLSDGRAMWK